MRLGFRRCEGKEQGSKGARALWMAMPSPIRLPLAWCPHHQQTVTRLEDQIVNLNFEFRICIPLVVGEDTNNGHSP
jgi:hypothetical protein